MKMRDYWLAAFGLALCLTMLAATSSAQNTAPQNQLRNNQAGPGAPNAAAPAPVGAPMQTGPLPPPFTLTPQEAADLDKLLGDWQKQSDAIKYYYSGFQRLEYNQPAAVNRQFPNGNPNQPVTVSEGELKYAAPDKGMFKVTKMDNYVLDPKTDQFVPQKSDLLEWWTCDGKSMYEVNDKQKLVVERPIPAQMQGKAITEGPLPFVFGAKAEALKGRYYLRVITPAAVADKQLWLEVRPKLQKDAANFSAVKLILDKSTFQLTAIQIDNPGSGPQNQSRTVFMLQGSKINSMWAPVERLFVDFSQPSPFGYKHVKEQDLAPPPPVQQASGTPPAAGQANRGAPQAR
jgi:TIGR03009 family protein